MFRHGNRCTVLFAVLAVTAFFFLPQAVKAQKDPPQDKLTYTLSSAGIKINKPVEGGLVVAFGKSMPKEYSDAPDDPARSFTLPDGRVIPASARFSADDWSVRVTRLVAGEGELVGHTVFLKPTGISRVEAPSNRLVALEFDYEINPATMQPVRNLVTGGFKLRNQPMDRLDPNKHQITIRFKKANFPSVVVSELPVESKTKVFTAAKGAADADIYFTGTATGAQKSKPKYAIETKLSYLQSLQQRGAIGGSFALNANEESDIDPDSMMGGGTYEYQRPFRGSPGTGLIFRSNFIGGEFNRKNTIRNLITGLDVTLYLPPAQFGETTFGAIEFTGGFEAGNNYRNKLAPEGIGAFWRPKFAVAAYLLALKTPLFKRVSFNTLYEVRLPRSAEIYSEMDGENEIFSLTKKPRHRVNTDLSFLFSDSYGMSLQYRYGTLPPAFKLERSNVKLGFVIQLKQANK